MQGLKLTQKGLKLFAEYSMVLQVREKAASHLDLTSLHCSDGNSTGISLEIHLSSSSFWPMSVERSF